MLVSFVLQECPKGVRNGGDGALVAVKVLGIQCCGVCGEDVVGGDVLNDVEHHLVMGEWRCEGGVVPDHGLEDGPVGEATQF